MNNTSIRLPMLAAVVFFSLSLQAATFESVQNGNWNSPSTWANNQVPAVNNSAPWPGNQIIILHRVSVGQNLDFTQQSGMTIESSGHLHVNGNFTIQAGNAGQFRFLSGSQLVARQFQAQSNNAFYSFAGRMELQRLTTSAATVSFSGELIAGELQVESGSSFTATGGGIQLSGRLRVSGGSSFILSGTNLTAQRFDRPDGNILVSGGTFSLSQSLTASGGGTIVFDGTQVNIGTSIVLSGSVGILVRGNTQLNASRVQLSGGSFIRGENAAGILTAPEIAVSEGAFIQCAQNNCYYGPNSLPPSSLNLATGAQSLPVSWESVSARASQTCVVVDWGVAAELNNDYFTVERSLDGSLWEAIASLTGRGTDLSYANYTFTDHTPGVGGTIYYRLRQTDFDGTSTVSRVVAVQIDATWSEQEWSVWPNPAIVSSTIKLQGPAVERVLLVLPSGQSQVLTVSDSSVPQEIQLPSLLPAGVYFLQISGAGQHQTLMLSTF